MNFQSASNGFDLLEYLSFSLSEYLQKKLSFLELQLISSNNDSFEQILEFSLSFIEFVNKLLVNNGVECTMSSLADVIERNFIEDVSLPSFKNNHFNDEKLKLIQPKSILQLLKSKTNKTTAYKFQLIMRFLYIKQLFEAEMKQKDRNFAKKMKKTQKELVKLLDLVRIAMQNENNEDFTAFFAVKIFKKLEDTRSLGFHHFLLDLSEKCELSEEITSLFKANLEKLKEKTKELTNSHKLINENIFSLQNNEQNCTEKTISTMNEDVFKCSIPTSLSTYNEKELSSSELLSHNAHQIKQKKTEPSSSPSKTSFSLDPNRKKIFDEIAKNNEINKNDPNFLLKAGIYSSVPPQIIEENNDSRSSSLVSAPSNHNNIHHGNNMNINANGEYNINNNANTMKMNFMKPKNSRSFGSTFGRKVVTLPINKKPMGVQHKSIFDHFIVEVGDKLMKRQLGQDKNTFISKLHHKEEEDSSSDFQDLLSWNKVVAFNTPIKEEYQNKNFDDVEIMSFQSMLKEIN